MISFIIIGRNEGWKLTKCFESVFNTIKYNHLNEFEVIYVDSKSTDDSIERVKIFNDVKIFVITGDCNAAIARNIGAKESTGDILFFIDGDMELISSFLPLVYSPFNGLIHPFVSGNWTNYNYDIKDKFIDKNDYISITADRYEKVTGGLFLISKKTWGNVNGMRNVFKRSQDIDLGLRLASSNILLLRKKEIAANHHTISYLNKERMWKDLFNGNELYGRSLLYRRNLLNHHIYLRIFRNDYTLLLLIISIIFLLVFKSFIVMFIYVMLIIAKSIKKSDLNLINTFNFLNYYLARDIYSFLGFFTFFPKRNFNVLYKRV